MRSANEGRQIDNRIRHGLAKGLALGILKKGDTIIAVQGWRSGGGSTNTVRLLSPLLSSPVLFVLSRIEERKLMDRGWMIDESIISPHEGQRIDSQADWGLEED